MVRATAKNYVLKRGGRKEEVHLDKITSRIQKLCYGLNADYVDPLSITLKVINGLYPGVTTVELDTLAAETAAIMTTQHPDYAILAARLAISNLQKETKKQFSEVIDDLYNATNQRTGQKTPLISSEHHSIIMKNANRLNSCIIYDRDFSYDYFAFKILERTCLLKINEKVVERPQHMLMRIAVGMHGEDLESAVEAYNYMSERYFIHDTSTLLHAATVTAKLCSSYIVSMPDDSLDAIYDCITQCAIIGNEGGEVGVNVQNIRAKGTAIVGTNGISNGLVPMLRVFNEAAAYVQNEISPEFETIYLEPWHADIMDFLNLKRPTGVEEYRARDLIYALWMPDLFMKRVRDDKMWSLMCPHQCQGLVDSYGDEFEKLYEKYEEQGKFVKQMSARDIFKIICTHQLEFGSPFIVYKDSCNRKSNHKNLGTIRGGNMSTEIIQYSSDKEVAVCATASIAVNMFVNPERNGFDFEKLKKVVKALTKNLNNIIDVTSYPLPEAKIANSRNRPIGIGVQGLADTFILLRMPYDSDKARLLNVHIFETIYYGALEASCEIAEIDGAYSTYTNSPISKGVLQYDMWNCTPTKLWDWSVLKEKIAKFGVRNSLLTALMPTLETARIFGNNKSTQPFTSNIYTGRVSSGTFQIVNHRLLKDLTERGLWNDKIKDEIIAKEGSIQSIPEIPEDLKNIYKTVWEIPQKLVINMAADRAPFIDQSQAMTIHMSAPSYSKMTSMHFYSWEKGLKTGLYVLKTNFSGSNVVPKMVEIKEKVGQKNGVANGENGKVETEEEEAAALLCSLQNPGACEMCSG